MNFLKFVLWHSPGTRVFYTILLTYGTCVGVAWYFSGDLGEAFGTGFAIWMCAGILLLLIGAAVTGWKKEYTEWKKRL